MKNTKSILLLLIISSLMFGLSMCIHKKDSDDPRGKTYAGAASCRRCHQSIYDGYITTAHYNTTQTSSEKNIHGSFTKGQHEYIYDSSTKVVMEKRDSGFFQVLYVNGKEQEAHRFDLTFGTRHAQTYLYWNTNKIFELPVSFYASVKSWASSPGFSSEKVNFKRFVKKECFECHSSNINVSLIGGAIGAVQEVYDKSSLISGIDCERCHGPAASHVNFHLDNPGIKEAKYIVKSISLSRQQKLDACAVCHSGNDKEKEFSTFQFRPGDTLANFFSPWALHDNKKTAFDVHGNQYQLLAQSKCFMAANAITCATCHNPHTDAAADAGAYSKKCISCHNTVDHSAVKMETAVNNLIGNNCIDCHMPKQPSQAITFQLNGSEKKAGYLLRTHRIAVY